jgi:tRNA pseudouridine55 synthase
VPDDVSRSNQIDGVLVVHKPVGPTSHDVVVCARRSLGVRRIGHTGTLDPHASGVLPLVLGQATRLAQHLSGSDKEYEAAIRFGVVTDTYDAAGTILEETGSVPSPVDVERALSQFVGELDQVPPLYSAKRVGGERSYVRARSGKPIQPPPVRVRVDDLSLIEMAGARARVRVRCSAGFYVRSLAHDLGRRLGSGAILDALVRTSAAGFGLADALAFEALVTGARADLRTRVHPMEALLMDVPAVRLTAEGARWALHGRELGPSEVIGTLMPISDLTRLLGPDDRLVGLAEPSKTRGFLHPAVIFSYN